MFHLKKSLPHLFPIRFSIYAHFHNKKRKSNIRNVLTAKTENRRKKKFICNRILIIFGKLFSEVFPRFFK